MSISSQQGFAAFSHLIAVAEDVDGQTVAVTPATWVNGAAANTHAFIYAVLTYKSGTLGICAGQVVMDTEALSGLDGLSGLDATHNKIYEHKTDAPQLNTAGSAIGFEVTTGSVAASRFDVKFYGLSL